MGYVYAVLGGALATSLAEYFFKYNLVDYVKDKVVALLGLAQSEASKLKAEVRAKLRSI